MKFLQQSLRSFSFAALLLLSVGLFSCKKDKEVVPAAPAVNGTWVGVFSSQSAPLQDYLAFKLKSGGVLEIIDNAGVNNGNGTWQLNGVNFKASFMIGSPTPVPISMIGTVENPNRISGAFGFGNSTVNGGFWHVERQP